MRRTQPRDRLATFDQGVDIVAQDCICIEHATEAGMCNDKQAAILLSDCVHRADGAAKKTGFPENAAGSDAVQWFRCAICGLKV